MRLERLSTAATAAWVIAACLVLISSGVLFITLPYDGALWVYILWAGIRSMWIAVVVGIVLKRKSTSGVRAGSRARQ